MIEGAHSLKCAKGNMELSEDLSAKLFAAFITLDAPKATKKLNLVFGGKWFCPRDASPMEEKNGFVTCQSCGRSLNEFLFTLIRGYPHL